MMLLAVLALSAAGHATPPQSGPGPESAPSAEQRLETLARQLNQTPAPAASVLQQLAQFAAAQATSPYGARAALALGYYEFKQKNFPEARAWLEKAAADPLLGDYALYWMGMTDRATESNAAAMAEFQQYRQRFPEGVMTDSAVEELARAALAVGRPQEAVAALEMYEKTRSRAALVLLRAQGREQAAAAQAETPLAAAADYLDVIYRFPLSDEAKTAADGIPALQTALGEQFPGVPVGTQIARAETLNQAARWSDLRDAYRELLPKLSGAARERAQLRIARADAALGAGLAELSSMELNDPDLDSERLHLLSQEYRSANLESRMLAAIELAAEKYPQSLSAADALFAAGNYFWTKLDRQRASEYYRRVIRAAPASPSAAIAQWRVLWTAYMAREDVRDGFERFLRQYPNSSYAADALYWLGRANERAGNVPHARSFYLTAAQRFPQTYFGGTAADRLREIGSEPINPAEFLSLLPVAAPLAPLDKSVPEAANGRWIRAQALRSIAFDASAELELRAAYDQTPAPGLLLAIAEAAADAGRYPVGIVAGRQLLPRLDARQFDEVPLELWRTVYPLPYRAALEREADRHKLDLAMVAGLIRQESAFDADAVSRRGAIGLMQIWPPTAPSLARSLRLAYSRAHLFDPEYNLRLGASYLATLLKAYDRPEFALAAYNAGESRVKEWTAGQAYAELPEFVESIPFTETRDYVQVVLRNAVLYRRIYGAPGAVTASAAPPQP
jgi:soluble lytic murein transglycosylase